jgi:hypothetical protein
VTDPLAPQSLGAVVDAGASDGPHCTWCGVAVVGRRWCSKRCRQTAWRARRLAVVEDLGDTPKRLAYADPPYPGLSAKYYRDEPSFGGEVDHRRLLEQLSTYDGWALSTSRRALPRVLSLGDRADVEIVVCPWVKTHHPAPARGPSNVHEYVIVRPARRRLPGVPDALVAAAARGGGALPGRKPIRFVLWLFSLLGAAPNDSLDDLFPGTGIVGRCWAEFCRKSTSATRRHLDGATGRRSAPSEARLLGTGATRRPVMAETAGGAP